MSKLKFYKKYGNTPDSAENKVESSVFQSRNLHKKDRTCIILHPMAYEILYARKVDLWEKN
jgi:hypothetical protein